MVPVGLFLFSESEVLIMITVQLRNGVRTAILKLPCRESEMEDTLKRIRTNGERPPQPLVTAVFPKDISMLENRNINLDELNYLAKRMSSFSPDELKKFYSALAYEQYTDMEDMINLAFNLHCYTLIRDVSSMEEVGKTMLYDLRGGMCENEFTSDDYMAIARELFSSDNVTLTKYGILYKNGVGEKRLYYDGNVFPKYAYTADWQWNLAVEYHGRTEYLFLPDEEAAIDKALARLGAGYPEDCNVSLEKSNISHYGWNLCLERIRKEEGLFELNELMQAVDPGRIDMGKFTAVIQYAEADHSAQIINLAVHLDEFGFIQSADDEWEIGRELFVSEFGIEINAALRGFFDFEAFGKAMMEKLGGEFIDGGGYVYLTGEKQLEEIMHPEEENMIADYYAGEMIGNRK